MKNSLSLLLAGVVQAQYPVSKKKQELKNVDCYLEIFQLLTIS